MIIEQNKLQALDQVTQDIKQVSNYYGNKWLIQHKQHNMNEEVEENQKVMMNILNDVSYQLDSIYSFIKSHSFSFVSYSDNAI